MEETKKKSFKYNDPMFLNDLISALSDNCKFSAFLLPDVEEFIEASKKFRSSMMNFEIPEELKEELYNRKINYFQWHTALIYNLSRKHNIIPFFALKFDGNYGPRGEIEYIGNNNYDLGKELYHFCNSPRTLALGNKWPRIEFKDFGKTGQEAISAFVEQGYRVTKIHADLNPRSGTSDHYYSWYKCDATLWASDGEIDMDGKFPDDFDPIKIQRKKLTDIGEKKALPGIPKLLEAS